MTRILLVEDSRITRNSIQQMLSFQPDFQIVAAIENAANAEILCLRGNINLILMDVCTADNESGLEAAANIKRRYPQIKIIIMTSMPEHSFIQKARAAGCNSFWYKEYGDQNLLDVIVRTVNGESVWPDAVPSVAVGLTVSDAFSERELVIMRELAKGEKYDDIAQHLGITVNTVKYHIKNLLQKTGYKNTLQLVAEVVEKQMILPKY